ncbi:pilus assembly protein [Hwanghaeella grinnelliae]|uniref:Pilus assembly protein n=1 Tax=Hwanghaeella grinnelliae TaxID=2500179 RepID=A0A3S2VNR5_9PROT|nr:TadE/TadG family type IV pilus assembly protein [Hwanghaeella grinnelliae]RVU38023.1 pilus assembly protein [Hwanghaeella grinnelliae]
MKRIRRFLKKFSRSRGGVTSVEFALTAPILVLLFTSLAETGIYLLLHVKLQHATVSVADLITRDESVRESTVADLFEAVPQILKPFSIGEDGVVVVSAVGRSGNNPTRVLWQRRGGGPLVRDSDIGAEGDVVSDPEGIPVGPDETVVVAELFYNYTPIVLPIFGPREIVKHAFYRPRLGALQEIDPDPPS